MKERILIVDDDYDHLLLCSLILQKHGYAVRTIPGCEEMDELTETVESFHPDLIFMDHEMRGICGMDLIKMLKATPEFARIPLIYFSSRDDIVQLAKDAGADGYFRKPFQAEGLLTAAHSFLVEN